MKTVLRATACLLVLAIPSSWAAAAPGKLTSTGPFGSMQLGVRDLVFPGADPKRILIRTENNLFESRDAGASWRSVLDNAPHIEPAQLVVDPADPDRWYVVEIGYGARIWQTADAGLSWSALPWPIEDPDDRRQMALFVDARDPRKLVVEISSFASQSVDRFLSQDRGASFSVLEPPDWPDDELILKGINDGSVYTKYRRLDLATGQSAGALLADADSDIVFDPVERDTLYFFTGPVLFKSSNRGATRQFLRDFRSPRFLVQSPWDPSHLAVASLQGLSLSLDRGSSWVNHGTIYGVRAAGFDPATGELLLASQDLRRRRLDGSISAPLPLVGLDSSTITAVAALGDRAMAVGFPFTSYFRDDEGVWQQRGDIRDPSSSQYCQGDTHAYLSPDDPDVAVAVCQTGAFTTTDAGWTWARSASGPGLSFPPFQVAANGSTLHLLNGGGVSRSLDLGLTWQSFSGTNFSGIAAHPVHGPLGVKTDGTLFRYLPATGWQPTGAELPGNAAVHPYLPYIVNEPAHPNLVYGIRGSLMSRSLDFGASWEVVSDLDQPQTYPIPNSWRRIVDSYLKVLIDPFDPDHLLLLVLGLESRDGGRTFFAAKDIDYGIAAFDRLTPGRFLVANAAKNGVLERTETLAACTTSDQAWCARFRRYLVTVDWKDPLGNRGRATSVETGSEDSGIFYFSTRRTGSCWSRCSTAAPSTSANGSSPPAPPTSSTSCGSKTAGPARSGTTSTPPVKPLRRSPIPMLSPAARLPLRPGAGWGRPCRCPRRWE